eukprot:4545401-Pleurochrysis_carterae.AAC.1
MGRIVPRVSHVGVRSWARLQRHEVERDLGEVGALVPARRGLAPRVRESLRRAGGGGPVSYTHLTLPTILLV